MKIAIAGGLLGYVCAHVDLHAVSRDIAAADPLMLLLAITLGCLSFPLGGVRWWCVVRGLGEDASPRRLTGLFWLAGLIAQVLPNPIGDAVRISAAARSDLGLGVALRSTILERVAMIAGLVVLIVVTQPLLRARVGGADPAWLGYALSGLGLAGLLVMATADLLLRRLRRFRVINALANLSEAVRALAKSPWLLAVSATVILSHLNTIAIAVVLGSALDLPLSLSDYLGAIPVAILAIVMPISIGGWGVREGVLLALLGAMGVPVASALAFSLLFGVTSLLASLPGVVTLLRSQRPHPTWSHNQSE